MISRSKLVDQQIDVRYSNRSYLRNAHSVHFIRDLNFFCIVKNNRIVCDGQEKILDRNTIVDRILYFDNYFYVIDTSERLCKFENKHCRSYGADNSIKYYNENINLINVYNDHNLSMCAFRLDKHIHIKINNYCILFNFEFDSINKINGLCIYANVVIIFYADVLEYYTISNDDYVLFQRYTDSHSGMYEYDLGTMMLTKQTIIWIC
jgi:hypothetical protein